VIERVRGDRHLDRPEFTGEIASDHLGVFGPKEQASNVAGMRFKKALPNVTDERKQVCLLLAGYIPGPSPM